MHLTVQVTTKKKSLDLIINKYILKQLFESSSEHHEYRKLQEEAEIAIERHF